MKILAVCQSGLGTSFMVQMNIQAILKAENVDTSDIQIDHTDVGSVTPDAADYFFVESTLAGTVSSLPKDRVVPLKSLIDKEETKQHVNEILDKEGIAYTAE